MSIVDDLMSSAGSNCHCGGLSTEVSMTGAPNSPATPSGANDPGLVARQLRRDSIAGRRTGESQFAWKKIAFIVVAIAAILAIIAFFRDYE